ncbi:MAG: S9 family peptidase [Bacteroidia bacterium]|nr:S9 family peptidase [Bacteroidia bacterium]MBP7243885.1 S9 family peptidase [Bacteroidia bacterium]
MNYKLFAAACLVSTILYVDVFSQALTYPKTAKGTTVDDYHGTKVSDPYRWLEIDTAKEVMAWVEAENKVTNAYLSNIPFRDGFKKRLTEIVNYEKFLAPSKVGDYYFFSKNDGLQNQSVIYYQRGIDGVPMVFIDPNKMSKDGTAAISILGFSHDKKHVAYGINESGSDWQTIKVMQVDGAKLLDDELKWVKFSSAAWYKDGFFYSRYDSPSSGTELSGKNENHQIWYHKLGTKQDADKMIFMDKENPLRYYGAQVTEDEKYLFIYVSQGTYGTEILYKNLDQPNMAPKKLFKGFSYEYGVVDNVGSKIMVSTNHGAQNNHLISLDLNSFNSEMDYEKQWKILVPETKSLLENVTTAGGKLFLNYLQDVSSHVYQYNYDGVKEHEVELPAIGTATGFSGYIDDKEVFFTFTSFTYPPTIYRYSIADKKVSKFRSSGVKFNPDDFTTEQVFFTSKDGTKVPMFIVYKKGLKRDGKNPTLLYAYGGFNVNLNPGFSATRLALLEQGAIYAMANIRGGGEYGDAWHKAGMLMKKQNVFDDFIAAAEYLISEKYTSPSYLAVQGGSNGGLLIGAVVNQRPELFKVAFPQVGVMDMLRFHKFTVGWGWVVEYGSSDTLAHFKNLYGYSPIHNIKPANYPAVMVTTADHDDRVVPAHSFKYIATLQENQKGTNPVLIRVDVKAGHGAGKPLSKTIDEVADTYSFMLYNMGVTPKW